MSTALLQELTAILGAENVLTDTAERRFYAQDVYREGVLPLAVIRPETGEQLADALRVIAREGLAVVPRGGGMSYTDGYLPVREGTISVDLLRMNKVVEINAEDGYVTVECGATWRGLHDTLAPHGLRTPYWGPLSGQCATIGGALSQGSMFLGSGRYGVAADSVVGLDVLLVDGTLLKLGSHANAKGAPFFRQYGPDTMGMFLSDTGALGIKLRATFRLVRPMPVSRHASFQFATAPALLSAMAAVARADVVSECFAFDPGLQNQRMKRARLADDVKTLGKVMKAAGGGLKGLRAGAKLVAAGRGFLDENKFSLHLSLDGRDEADADARLAIVRAAVGAEAAEVEPSVPKVMRANPFADVTSMLGPGGERWVPVHGITSFSRAADLFASCEAVFARFADEMTRFDIDHGYLMATVGTSGTLLEPVLYWPEARMMFHERVLPADYLAKLPTFPANPEATAAVARIRAALAENFTAQGAVSFQLGKFYPYQSGLEPAAAQLLRQLKALVDPDGRMNPGSLGLGN
ncbi:MAG TPA: FAD-binding oxidoreductase [Steroidobacteraceae bacterium]|nr:FAD-binding oxidoreductase [Steroidobacteraceae bacterium]